MSQEAQTQTRTTIAIKVAEHIWEGGEQMMSVIDEWLPVAERDRIWRQVLKIIESRLLY